MVQETPQNKFREEIEKQAVSEQEMLERDQRITYLLFKNQAEMHQADCLHLQQAISKLKAFGNEIFQLPDSEARTSILVENNQHLEKVENQLKATRITRAQQVILSILEEKFGEDAVADEPEELKDE